LNLKDSGFAVLQPGPKKEKRRRCVPAFPIDERTAVKHRAIHSGVVGRRIDRELGGDFDPAKFRHRALWDEERGRVEMWLDSLEDQTVTIARLGMHVTLKRGESIHTENSYKYSEAEIDALAAAARLRVEGRWFDVERRFSETLLAPA
jgi:uncharacterized SAM-dependent methyltransferase